ncbi:MAG: prolyl oligopeptidase family serine peptidase [Sciscionella sp.]
MQAADQTRAITYPVAERQPVVDELHGHRVEDPYRWLEDPESAATKSWQTAQNELWRGYASALPGRERLNTRVAELSDPGMVAAPVWRGRRRFFLRQGPGQEHAVLYTTQSDGAEDVLVDPVALDPSGLTTLDIWQPDLDGELVAYQISRSGDERSELFVLDVERRRIVDGPIDRCRYSPVAWLPGGEAFYYVRAIDELANSTRVYLHRLGTSPDVDVLVFRPDQDEPTSYGIELSEDGRWLVVSATGGAAQCNDLWLADLAASTTTEPEFRTVQRDVEAKTVLHVGRDGRMYVATNLDAPRGRLCVADPRWPEPDAWVDLVAQDQEAVLGDFTVLDGSQLERPLLLVNWIRHAISEISVHDLASGGWLHDVPLPGLGSTSQLATRASGRHEVWFTYTDSVSPVSVYRYDALARRTTVDAPSPGGVAMPTIAARHIEYTSGDGTQVRMVVLAKPNADGGPRPTILYGYGGFGLPLVPSYSSYILAWVEAGGVFAVANLRGGGEEGEEWHRAGMLESKQNVFDDFAAAAERLVTGRWTTAEQLGICGESNGGLLVGAALTQWPERFAAAVCSAPILDMVRYERFGLGPRWSGEYGSAEDPEQFDWLLGYSPYHHVRDGADYPAVLFTVFGWDTRVDPLHARKMCAALQAASASDRPVLLRHEGDVGHGARAASRAVALAADMLAFLAAHTGLDVSGTGDPP